MIGPPPLDTDEADLATTGSGKRLFFSEEPAPTKSPRLLLLLAFVDKGDRDDDDAADAAAAEDDLEPDVKAVLLGSRIELERVAGHAKSPKVM